MSHQDTFDLSTFPPPEAIQDLDFEVILARMRDDTLERMPSLAGYIDLETEPSRILIEAASYSEMLVRERVNDAIRANLLAFANGADLDHLAAFYDEARMLGEDDERFRFRTILAIRGRSPGGTVPRYQAIAMAADIRVADVEVYRVGTSPVVHIAVFSTDNDGLADAPLLATVRAAVNDDAHRMVSDTLVVEAAVFQVVNVTATIKLLPTTPAGVLTTLPASVKAAWLDYSGLGLDLTRAWLTKALMVEGVQNVAISAPASDVVAAPQVAISIGTVTIIDGGRAQ